MLNFKHNSVHLLEEIVCTSLWAILGVMDVLEEVTNCLFWTASGTEMRVNDKNGSKKHLLQVL